MVYSLDCQIAYSIRNEIDTGL